MSALLACRIILNLREFGKKRVVAVGTGIKEVISDRINTADTGDLDTLRFRERHGHSNATGGLAAGGGTKTSSAVSHVSTSFGGLSMLNSQDLEIQTEVSAKEGDIFEDDDGYVYDHDLTKYGKPVGRRVGSE